MSPTKKATLNARVKIVAGPAANLYGRIAAIHESTWSADITLDDGRTAKGVPLKHVTVIDEDVITDREKLLDRIRKLNAKAESAKAIGSDAEAASFAAAVQKMLAKYKLSMSDIEYAAMERDEPIDKEYVNGDGPTRKRQRVGWAESLCAIVARAHYCRMLVINGSDSLILVGRATDRAVASFVFTTLRRTASELSDKEARAFRKMQRKLHGFTDHQSRDFRAAWLNAFVLRVAERYRKELKKDEQLATAAGTSLVRLTTALQQVDTHMASDRSIGTAKASRIKLSANEAGARAGRAAGSAVNIRGTGLGAGAATTQRRLS